MRKVGKWVFGGIQSKIFNLILYTVLLMSLAYMAVSLYQYNMLTQLAAESNKEQQESIGKISGQVMDAVVVQSLARSNETDAAIVDAMFDQQAQRVRFVADRVAALFAHPEDYLPKQGFGPDPADDGTWKAKIIYADGVDPEDPEIAARVGLISNLSDMIASLCPAVGADTLYIGLPEGIHLTVSDTSSSWIMDGKVRSYDPRQRGWYQKAVAEGELTYNDNETDIDTGSYCIECAAPVYAEDGTLLAVVGTDMFLDNMQNVLQGLAVEGEYYLLVNHNGIVIPGPQAEIFPMSEEDKKTDLREADNEMLRQVTAAALKGEKTSVQLGELTGGKYYLTASPIASTGWALVSAFDEALSSQPITMLQSSSAAIQEKSAATYKEKVGNSRTMGIVLMIIVMLLTLGGALVLGKRIVTPLNTITERISQLSEGNLEFKMEDVYRTKDEVEELAESFARISHKTVEYMQKVVQVTAEKERIGAELSLATNIQASMLPHIFPAFPDRPEFDIFASMDPAKEVGGDFYDYFLRDEDHLCLVIADVSGKGVPGALFMMASKIMLQSVAMMDSSPAQILRRTNDAICSNNEAQMFVTVWMGILELSTGKLTASNAGHEFPAFKRPGGKYELYKDPHGFVIGGMEGIKYREYELQLEPGTKLFVYTDGVPEATNAEKELYGTERMIDALNSNPDAEPREVLENVRTSVDNFVKDAEQFDDMTMLCLEYKGKVG